MNRKCIRLFLGVLLLTGAGWAQQTATSGIVGQVIDTTQAAIAGAAVTVTNTGTHAQRTATTDAQGNFSVPNLPPATYEIRVENKSTGAGVVITGDQPLANLGVWAVRTVVAPEPFIAINIAPGGEFRWKYTYSFYLR